MSAGSDEEVGGGCVDEGPAVLVGRDRRDSRRSLLLSRSEASRICCRISLALFWV